MTIEERLTELECQFKKELAEIKVEIANQNQPKFKKGDLVTSEWGSNISATTIFSHFDGDNWLHFYYGGECGTFNGSIGALCERKDRLASESEKQLLLDKLHEAGKDWDAEKCKIVDYRWVPKQGTIYYVPLPGSAKLFYALANTDHAVDRRLIEKNLAFKTPKEAIKVARGWLDSLK